MAPGSHGPSAPPGHLRGHVPGRLPWGPCPGAIAGSGEGPEPGRRLGVLALVDQDGAQQVAAEGGGGTGAAPLGQTGPGREQAGHAVRPAHLQVPLGAFPQLAGEVAGFDLRPGPPHQAPVGEQDQVIRAEGQQVRAGHPALRDRPPAPRAGLTGAPSPPPRWPARRGSWPPRGPPDRPAAWPGHGRSRGRALSSRAASPSKVTPLSTRALTADRRRACGAPSKKSLIRTTIVRRGSSTREAA